MAKLFSKRRKQDKEDKSQALSEHVSQKGYRGETVIGWSAETYTFYPSYPDKYLDEGGKEKEGVKVKWEANDRSGDVPVWPIPDFREATWEYLSDYEKKSLARTIWLAMRLAFSWGMTIGQSYEIGEKFHFLDARLVNCLWPGYGERCKPESGWNYCSVEMGDGKEAKYGKYGGYGGY